MNFKLPYQYSFSPAPAKIIEVDCKVVPDDTLSPKDIITKFSKGINDPRVKDLGEGSYLTSDAGLDLPSNPTMSDDAIRQLQDSKLLGVILPDPSCDYSEFEEFSKQSAEKLSKIVGDAKARAKAAAAPPVPPAPAPPAPPAPAPPAQ